MALPSDRLLFVLCIVAATAGLLGWRAFVPDLNGGVVLLLAIGVLAFLFFVDGFVQHRE